MKDWAPEGPKKSETPCMKTEKKWECCRKTQKEWVHAERPKKDPDSCGAGVGLLLEDHENKWDPAGRQRKSE
jgi:hypothetical protein